MILSGVSQMADQLSKEDLHNQIQAVEAMLTDAQNDMRVLLLHLRPTELENKTLQEGLQMILKELTDKSNIHVVYKDMVKKVPKALKIISLGLPKIYLLIPLNTLRPAR